MKKLEKLQQSVGYKFKDERLLQRALTHTSYANECNEGHNKSNERLEFLGDSVLGIITAEHFYLNFKDLPEGELTKLRAATVCENSLSSFARQLGLGEYLLLGKGEMCTGGSDRPSILADAFEALIAAIYRDGGIEEAKKFVLKYVDKAVEEHRGFKDYKTVLQEVIQKNPGEVIEYVLVKESGPDHNKRFEVEVHLNSNVIGKGVAGSKKKAEQAAAQQALELMGI